ncbi:tetratricopeptide repeat protein [Stigmatella sp. ncwal1]|uniref:Tetratricopeptide repeat protein n=1 Tax=Stigmatella ashevillensis TaxID=2995309 RepID=A0ABT5DKP0_9BACT|nr:tetratricopeptide repeat protein [Stigmatella ashevillena]MDC0714217.1 tetratricopeptide repeat protein [Stigmatella ashevillena]
MRQTFTWMIAIFIFRAAEGQTSDEKIDARLIEAQAFFDEATKLLDAGNYSEAFTQAEQALSLRETILGGSHPDVASCLNLVGNIYRRKGVLATAEPLFQRALDIREASLGKNHPAVADSLNDFALLYSDKGLYDRAEPLFQRALDIREASLGKDHPAVADSLNGFALLYFDKGLYDRAEPLIQRALAIQEASLGKNHPKVAGSLSNLALLYYTRELYDRAEPLIQRALAIQEASLGKNHPKVAGLLHNLALLYKGQGLYDQAVPFLQRALTIQEASLGKHHPTVGINLNNLADLYFTQGLYGQAEPLFQHALDVQEAALGKNHPLVAGTLQNLANLYADQGLYGRAEPLLQRSLNAQEASFGKNHPNVAGPLISLAILYSQQGLYDSATPLFQRALTIQETSLGKNHPAIADSLNNLATIYSHQGLHSQIEPLLQRALAIQEAARGKNHPSIADSLTNLAIFYYDQGLYGRVEPLLRRVLTIREAALGNSHPDIAATLHNLAVLYRSQKLYGRAEPLFRRALAIQEAALGKSHPSVAEDLNEFGILRLAQNRLSDALPFFFSSFSISERRLRHEALDFSESRLSSFLAHLLDGEQRLYALLRAYPQDTRVQRLALTAALLLKGRSVSENASISRALYLRMGSEDRDSFERLRGLRTQLASLSFSRPSFLSPEAYQQRIQALTQEGDSLEAELAKRSAPLRSISSLPFPDNIVDRVSSSLPKDSALVEFIAYNDSPLIRKPSIARTKNASHLRYLALVLFPDASIRSVDLGPAFPIDQAASRLRDALADKDASFQTASQQFYQSTFAPLRPLLGSTRRIFLSTDGQLSLVPFSALHDGHAFLLDSFDFSYLTSGRELLPRPPDSAPSSSVFVFADPDFSSSFSPVPYGSLPSTPPSDALERFFSLPPSNLDRSAWVPLPGARLEAYAIQRLIPQAQLFLGPDASKQRLLNLPTPGILHLATHGFFLGNPSASSSAEYRGLAFVDSLGGAPPPQPEPLLNSGLVLAGALATAASSPPAPEASLVTALELAGLNLWGTQLVVLSACDTGRGEVHLGQGVYGLRRALMAAGTETLLISLWKVNDNSTHFLMDLYYRNLLKGLGRASALREAMLSLRTTHPHPHAWAPFIALGSNAPLRSMTPIPAQTPKPAPKPDDSH